MKSVLLGLVMALGFGEPQAPSFVDTLTPDSKATRQQIQSLLESPDVRDAAWGSWLAGRDSVTETVPLLQKVVSSRMYARTWQDEAARDLALDALVHLDAQMDPDWLRSVFAIRPAQAMLLMSRLGSRADETLLKLSDSVYGPAWFASSNLLLEHRAKGFAASLLRKMHFKVDIFLYTPGFQCVGQGSAADYGPEMRRSMAISGYPPWPSWYMSAGSFDSSIDAQQTFKGPIPVFYRRIVEENLTPKGAANLAISPLEVRPDDEDRMTYALALLPGTSVGHTTSTKEQVVWTNEDAYVAERDRVRHQIQTQFSALLEELKTRSLISSEEAIALAKAQIEISRHDCHN